MSQKPAPQPTATPLDGDDFLTRNRENREQARAEAERKAARKASRVGGRAVEDSSEGSDGGPVDRTPGKVPAARRFTVRGSRKVFMVIAALSAAVVVLAASTGVLAYTTWHARSDDAGVSTEYRQQAMDAARTYAVDLTTYDAANYADLDRRIRAISTQDFATRYIASSRDARQGNATARGASKAEAKEAGLQSISGDKAVVLVALDQTVTSPQVAADVPGGIPYQSRVQITLVHRDGRWLLDDLKTV